MEYFISAPFGNFLQYSTFASNATCVTGTFTLKPRPGRLKQILRTLRYVKTKQGWTWRNQLGLRNPGIFAGLENTNSNSIIGEITIINYCCRHYINLFISLFIWYLNSCNYYVSSSRYGSCP